MVYEGEKKDCIRNTDTSNGQQWPGPHLMKQSQSSERSGFHSPPSDRFTKNEASRKAASPSADQTTSMDEAKSLVRRVQTRVCAKTSFG